MGNIDMKLIEDIEKRACKELDKINDKKEWGPADFALLHQLTGTVKNTMKIQEHGGGYAMNGNGYAQAGRWTAHGSMEGDYGHAGQHRNSMGQYARDDGYSSNGGNYLHELERMADRATGREREALLRCARDIRNG